MCGIYGANYTAPEVMHRAAEHLRPRGPDGSGVYSDGVVTLGHTLLALRDAAGRSHQPYTRPGQPWVLLYNGQIYNTKQLWHALRMAGPCPDLDTAVVYRAIETYGWAFAAHLHGMFAIALYHTRARIVRLYRDVTGQKILYYYHHRGRFIFSSDIGGILVHDHLDRTPDAEAIALATQLGYLPGDKTLFAHIHKVQPAEVITFDCRHRRLSRQGLLSQVPTAYYDDETVFTQLVAEHVPGHHPVGINLSGGLDSSLVFHELRHLGYPVQAYTTQFEGVSEGYNEDARLATRLADEYGAALCPVVVSKASYQARFVESYRRVEEPSYNISLPIYLQTAEHEGSQGDGYRVILSGDGGDELFAGYPYYYAYATMPATAPRVSPHNGLVYHVHDPIERWLFFNQSAPVTYVRPQAFALPAYIQSIATSYLQRYRLRGHAFHQVMVLDRVLWLASENFIRTDKIFMSQSIELRAPLAYHPFRVHFDTRLLPPQYHTAAQNKCYLRARYADKLPPYITARARKSGWKAPIAEWYDADMQAFFLSLLPPDAAAPGLVDWPALKRDIARTPEWPGKYIHLYLSLAILADYYRLAI